MFYTKLAKDKKYRSQTSAGKEMMALEPGVKINAELKRRKKKKRPRKLRNGIIILHDNACPYVAERFMMCLLVCVAI